MRDSKFYQPIPDLPEYVDFRTAADNSILMAGTEELVEARRRQAGRQQLDAPVRVKPAAS